MFFVIAEPVKGRVLIVNIFSYVPFFRSYQNGIYADVSIGVNLYVYSCSVKDCGRIFGNGIWVI